MNTQMAQADLASIYRATGSLRLTAAATDVAYETARKRLLALGVELRQRGGHGRKPGTRNRGSDALDRRIARLRKDGLSLREIGERVCLCPTAVWWRLHREGR